VVNLDKKINVLHIVYLLKTSGKCESIKKDYNMIVIIGILLMYLGRIVATLLAQWGHQDMELYKLF